MTHPPSNHAPLIHLPVLRTPAHKPLVCTLIDVRLANQPYIHPPELHVFIHAHLAVEDLATIRSLIVGRLTDGHIRGPVMDKELILDQAWRQAAILSVGEYKAAFKTFSILRPYYYALDPRHAKPWSRTPMRLTYGFRVVGANVLVRTTMEAFYLGAGTEWQWDNEIDGTPYPYVEFKLSGNRTSDDWRCEADMALKAGEVIGGLPTPQWIDDARMALRELRLADAVKQVCRPDTPTNPMKMVRIGFRPL